MGEIRFEIVPDAAQDLAALPEDKASGLIRLFRGAQEGFGLGVRTVYKGRRGKVLLISQDDYAAEALVDPLMHSFTVISVQPANEVDPEHATANALSDIESTERPQAIPFQLERIEEIQARLRRLLPAYGFRRYRITKRKMAAAPRKQSLVERLFPVAHRWKMREARNVFKNVLEAAEIEPQVIERDGKEYLVIERALLQNFERPLDAAELAAEFAHRQLPSIDLNDDVRRHPEPELTFSVRPANG